jgi:quinol-cytochrome oxidoreductase complex cytochrome b subunit
MVDLHETNKPQPNGSIDTIGWLFVVFVVVITVAAAMIAYNANDITVTNIMSHIARPTG